MRGLTSVVVGCVLVLVGCGYPAPNDFCELATDCPAIDNGCQTASCTAGHCEKTFASAGLAVATQTSGDCQELQCDGAGNVESVSVDDPPDDGNPCTVETCAAGVSETHAADAATACGTSLECDGAGNCVGCLNAAECPAGNNECKARACSPSGTCGFTNVPQGVAVSSQTQGDCQKVVCNGAGGSGPINDDTDLPTTTNPCAQPGCNQGVPFVAFRPVGFACGNGHICDGAGECVECVMATDCPGTDTICKYRVCNGAIPMCSIQYASVGTACATNMQCDGNGNCVP